MFSPNQDDVRRFFCEVHRKQCEGSPLTPMESSAAQWTAEHPEYHAVLGDVDVALATTFDGSSGEANPFLHLSMHLSISEQVSIDQPRGIKQAYQLLLAHRGSPHDAHHDLMECLGRMLWQSQRSGMPPDGDKYIECVRRRATRK